MNKQKVTVLGAGAWGAALAITFSHIAQVSLWSRNPIHQPKSQPLTEHAKLPSVNWPPSIQLLSNDSLKTAIEQSDGIIIATPSHAFRSTLLSIKPYLTPKHQITWGTKGIEKENHLLMCEIAQQLLPKYQFCSLSGPSFAIEMAKKQPTSLVFAAHNPHATNYWVTLLGELDFMNLHTSSDIKGICLIGCLKNTLAIASGICCGLSWGSNAISALISYGVIEIQNALNALKCDPHSLLSVAGLGDIMLTCLNQHSRNYRFGQQLAQGLSVRLALNNINQTVEGYESASSLHKLIDHHHINVPILLTVCNMVQNDTLSKEILSEFIGAYQKHGCNTIA